MDVVKPEACGCVIAALAKMAPDPRTERGRYFACRLHGQMVLWTGDQWRWSDRPEDIRQLPRMADYTAPAQMPD